MKTIFLIILSGFFVFLHAQVMYEVGQINGSYPWDTSGDQYGSSVDIDGDYAIVGALYNSHGVGDSRG